MRKVVLMMRKVVLMLSAAAALVLASTSRLGKHQEERHDLLRRVRTRPDGVFRHAQPIGLRWWLPVMTSTLLILSSCTSRGAESGSAGTEGPDRESEALTRAEYQDRLYDCFRDQGLNVNESGENVEIEADGFDEALAACEAILGRPPEPASLTDEEITSLYEQSLAAATCLEALGYDISEPPSLEEFIESYRLSMEGGPPPWLPHGDVQGEVAQCPQPTLD